MFFPNAAQLLHMWGNYLVIELRLHHFISEILEMYIRDLAVVQKWAAEVMERLE